MFILRRRNLLLFLFFAILFSFIRAVPVEASEVPVSLAARIGKESMPNTVAGLQLWYQQDKAYLSNSGRRDFGQEITLLTRELKLLESRPDYRDSSGFSVYLPITSGRIHLLSAGIAARQSAGASYPFDELLGHTLKMENPTQYPDLGRVVRTLKGLDLPKEAFEGFHVYLLPYSMGEANGYGGNGYAFLAAAPSNETLISNQLEVTLVHEFGHYLSFRFMDRNTAQGRALWDKFLKIRGITWHDAGEAGSKAWGLSSEEVFAEDFRVWMGKSVVGSGYFGDLAYPEPNTGKGLLLRHFFAELPKQTPSAGVDPWLNLDKEILFAQLNWEPFLFGAAGSIGLAVLILANKKRPLRPRNSESSSLSRS